VGTATESDGRDMPSAWGWDWGMRRPDGLERGVEDDMPMPMPMPIPMFDAEVMECE
jgi:hypothetical protein